MKKVADILYETFGHTTFRPGQEEVIGHLLAGRSTAAVFPTGSGKSLCYQLPAVLLPGLTLVVSPLLALMREQCDRLRARGVAAARLDSTLTADESRAVMADLRAGTLQILFLAPERFNNERTREALVRQRIALFAVDEAHCISEWGHNFRPDYLKLVRFARRCNAERVLALTATATPAVLRDMCTAFNIDPAHAVRTGFHRPNLSLLVTPGHQDRDGLLARRIRERGPAASIVYVTTQKTAERLAAQLTAGGTPARAYHAGLDTPERTSVQEWFNASSDAVVVATIAFGMGIDKPDIRAVYHYNLPKSLENYSQEIGRAGRDGAPAHCEMFAAMDDAGRLEGFVYGDTPARGAVRGLLATLFDPATDDELLLGLIELGNAHDLRANVLSTLLTYLELDGLIEAGTPVYTRYRFQPQTTSADILSHYDGDERAFLAMVLKQSVKARTWFDLDLARAQQATGATRERVVEALDHLGERGFLKLEATGLRHRYRRLQRVSDIDALADVLHGKLLEREAREIGRLGHVMELATLDGCMASHLGGYFGEPLGEGCGRCTWCLTGKAVVVPPRPVAVIDERVWRDALAVREKHPDPLAEPRAFTRFLCGLPSPRLTIKKLTGHALYGALEDVPFRVVMERVP